MGFLIGMAVLIGLTALVVNPIVNSQFNARLNAEGLDEETLATLPPEEIKHWKTIHTQIYILWDVIILGVAGFLFGYFTGMFLIGISLDPKGWPGMIVFIGLSFLGSGLRGA